MTEDEVTPEMIDAGADVVLSQTSCSYFSARDLAVKVYRAMHKAQWKVLYPGDWTKLSLDK